MPQKTCLQVCAAEQDCHAIVIGTADESLATADAIANAILRARGVIKTVMLIMIAHL